MSKFSHDADDDAAVDDAAPTTPGLWQYLDVLFENIRAKNGPFGPKTLIFSTGPRLFFFVT